MRIMKIPVVDLAISAKNVRTKVEDENDETDLEDLADNIKAHGLLNPPSVRHVGGDKYEVIAGQRRYLAVKSLGWEEVHCNVLSIDENQSEVVSLIENVQRTDMTSKDKVNVYGRLYDTMGGDIYRLAKTVHLGKETLKKYIRIRTLDPQLLERLDQKGEDRITVDLATELAEAKERGVCPLDVMNRINAYSSKDRLSSLRTFNATGETSASQIEALVHEAHDMSTNQIRVRGPFVYDDGEILYIPEELWKDVAAMVASAEPEPEDTTLKRRRDSRARD